MLLVTINCEILVPNSRFSTKPVAILLEMLSNFLIHFPNGTRRALSIPLLRFYTKHPHLPKICKICDKKPFKTTSNFVKPCAICPQMLSSFLIRCPSRTRRTLSISPLCFYTKHRQLSKISTNYQKTLQKYIEFCKILRDSPTNAFQLSYSLFK